MPRTTGAKDFRKRKIRKDKGRRRDKYKGRQIIRFPKRRGNKESLKIWFWEQGKMSREGYSKWSRYVRRHIRPIVYRFRIRADVPIEMLSTKEAIEELALEVMGYEGNFIIMGISGSPRTRTGLKWVKLCRVIIRNSQEGLRARFAENFRLWRYWFWRDN